MSAAPIRVGLVDDHAVVRFGYRRLLELEGLSVALEAGDAESAYAALGRHARLPVDVLIVDLALPGHSGLALLRRVRGRWPDARVLIFTMHDDAGTVTQCLRAGAAGFVTKSSDPELLIDAVRQVARGQVALSPDIAALTDGARTAPHAGLGTREFDVLNALLDGHGVEAIALRLRLSPKTVANYQTTIRQKLGVVSAMGLLQYARQHGLRH
ncbi:response regulator transcription factor [Aquabacterium sp. OR-4]|uniref:response regulator transcription factor n=1 Tax=Aquabacterium sp. OR-4 TaxID=2978127 RepID=UPI0021B1C624|nr:response regulator transcription factor [Aquabacterium sp. OR-4]MDT7838407.1 response regulator transcription factor [Aquabacterium sp. OR-4]